MDFFDRENEIGRLRSIRERAATNAQLTVVTGRRRIGKTSLVLKAYADQVFLYFFVSRSTESELCQEFANEIATKLNQPIIGRVEHFAEIFQYVVDVSKSRPLTLIIDEFQDFSRVNNAIFSQMQKIWDLNKNQARLNLVICGSVFSMITKLFRDYKEPLYDRQTEFLQVGPFAPSVLKQVLTRYSSAYDNHDLLALYTFTGGVAKYVEMLIDAGKTNANAMMRHMVDKDSFFIYEGKNMLVTEFGRDYGRYFDILRLIASGHNSRGDIEGILNKEVSGYLSRMETDYGLIVKNRPMFQQSANKNVRYAIKDHFLRFWFRFVYKYNSIIEANAYDKLLQILERDYNTYSGRLLEDYFRSTMVEKGSFTHIGSWWDCRGENEIDIIAADDIGKKVSFFEVKRQRQEINLEALKAKANYFYQSTGMYTDYQPSYIGLCIDDM